MIDDVSGRGRARSRLDPDFRDADRRLEEWGRWAGGDVAFLGFPAKTALAKVQEEGFVGAASEGAKIYLPDSVVKADNKTVCWCVSNPTSD